MQTWKFEKFSHTQTYTQNHLHPVPNPDSRLSFNLTSNKNSSYDALDEWHTFYILHLAIPDKVEWSEPIIFYLHQVFDTNIIVVHVTQLN